MTSGVANGVTKVAAQAPFDSYKLPTLTAGSWILYPGYATVFGSFTSPKGTMVMVKAGANHDAGTSASPTRRRSTVRWKERWR